MSDEKHTGHYISFREQWSWLFRPTNWDEFDIVRISWEHDAQLGSFSLDLALVGVGVQWTWAYAETDYGLELRRRVAEAKRSIDEEK